MTHEDLVAIYDKDLCRAFPLEFKHLVDKDGISAGYYSPPDSIFAPSKAFPDNKCFCPPDVSPESPCELQGLQNISPCHYGTLPLSHDSRPISAQVLWYRIITV